MPDPSLMTTAAWEYVDDLPAFFREDPLVQAVAYAVTQEFARVQSFLDRVQANMLPSTADALTFPVWEALFEMQHGTESDAERCAALAARWTTQVDPGSGSAWVLAVTQLLGSGWAYLEHVPGATPPTPGFLTVIVRVPFASGSDEFRRAQDFLNDFSPANITFVMQAQPGFALDLSQLDAQPL